MKAVLPASVEPCQGQTHGVKAVIAGDMQGDRPAIERVIGGERAVDDGRSAAGVQGDAAAKIGGEVVRKRAADAQ